VKGWPAYIVSFVLYAAFFFAVLYALKKYGHIDIFRLAGIDQRGSFPVDRE
jgi:hypothetical protein